MNNFKIQKIDELASGGFQEPERVQIGGREGNSARGGEEVFKDPTAVADFLRKNQKLIAMGRQVASITHEINNPLESIANLLFLLNEERELSSNAKSYLLLAQRELDRVIQISKQTLNFYRDTPKPVEVQISKLLDETLLLYSRKIQEKQLKISRKYDPGQTATVFPGGLRQVFSNLIVNAMEACPRGGTLCVRVRFASRWSDGTPGVRITIADNGSGIDAAIRRTLGKPFLTTKGHQGTGLGIWVTMAILRQHGSILQNRSSVRPEKHGTVFSIFLPENMPPSSQEDIPDEPANFPFEAAS